MRILRICGIVRSLLMTRLREWHKSVILLGITLLMCFVILEVSLRIVSYPVYGFQEGVFMKDKNIGYKLSPNYEGVQSIYGKTFELRTNSDGLRDDREYSYERTDKVRILILGDSYAFGNGVNLEETYAEFLREDYENAEIINLGVPGYGINNEYLSYVYEGAKYNPDIILIGFMNNDWGTHQILESNGTPSINEAFSLPVNDKGLLASSEGFPRNVHLWLLFHVRSYSFAYTKSRLILRSVIDRYWGDQGIPIYFKEKNSSEYKEAYEGYKTLLKDLKESTNATIVILIPPFTEDLYSQEQVQQAYHITYPVNTRQAKESVKEIAKELNIRVIEIESDDPSIYLPVDNHWNPNGHRLVADGLYRGLNGLIVEKETSLNHGDIFIKDQK